MSARDHYESLLAEHYTWSVGDFEEAVRGEVARLRRAGVPDGQGERAIDLGAGSGIHSIALARMGYRVTAVDFSPTLLDEVRRRSTGLPIECVEADIRTLPAQVPVDARVIVSMGDTVLHLASRDEVRELFRSAHERLRPAGIFVAGFRDLTLERQGVDRFLPVRSDTSRILTCFLEYLPDRVIVHDLLHVHRGEGWRLRASSYEKLRLAPRWIEGALLEAGFSDVAIHQDVRFHLATASR